MGHNLVSSQALVWDQNGTWDLVCCAMLCYAPKCILLDLGTCWTPCHPVPYWCGINVGGTMWGLMELVPLHALLVWNQYGTSWHAMHENVFFWTWGLVGLHAIPCLHAFMQCLGVGSTWDLVREHDMPCHALVRNHYVTWDLTWWYGQGPKIVFLGT